MLNQDLRLRARLAIKDIAMKRHTDPNLPVLLLGPYVPSELCLGVLEELKLQLIYFGITPFIEKDIDLEPAALHQKLSVLSSLCVFAVFIIPQLATSSGWKTEIGQLNHMYNRVMVFYEDRISFSTVAWDIVTKTEITAGNFVNSADKVGTCKYIASIIAARILDFQNEHI